MDSTAPSAAPTALYTNAAPPAARPPSSTPSRPPSCGNSGNSDHRNKNNNKNCNGGHGGGNNGRNSNGSGGRNSSSGPITIPTASDGRHAMADLWPPVAGAHHCLPRPGVHMTAASACLHGHTRLLSVTRVPTRPSAAPAGRSRSLTRLEPLGQRGLGPTIAGPLLQHHGAPPTSDFGPGLGGRLRRGAPHHSVSW
jgi:hypothetical protein